MKITKEQLKQIIKEELEDTLNEKLQGGIDELAQEYGVAPLPERFTNQQLVDFTYELIEVMPRAEMGPVSGPRALPTPKQGETHKQRAEKYAAADLGSRLATPHVLSTSGVGHALEKLLMKRKSQEQNEEMRQALEDARMALLNAVSPSGRQAALRTAKTAERGDQSSAAGTAWGPDVKRQRSERAKWSKQFNESQLEQIVKEELDNLKEYEEDNPYASEPQGHPAVVKANDALHEAYLAVDELSDIIEQQPDSVSGMAHASPSLSDVKSKIESLSRLVQYLG